MQFRNNNWGNIQNYNRTSFQANTSAMVQTRARAGFKPILRIFFRGLLLLFALFLLVSCGEDSPLACEETYYVSNDNKVWLTNDSIGDSFVMTDQNGISQSFTMQSNYTDFDKSWGGYFFITTHRSYREQYYQDYGSTYDTGFSLSLSALWDSYGDEISVQVGRTYFTYNFNYQKMSRLGCGDSYMSMTMTDQGYEEENETYSTLSLLDSLRVGNILYREVLHFTCLDLAEEWEDYTVKEIYLAKHYGLIKYALQNGLVYSRN